MNKNRLMILLAALFAFWPALKAGFIADDPFVFFQDPAIHRWDATQLRCDFASCSIPDINPGYYRPLDKIFLRAEFSVFGPHPLGYHLVNFLFHAVNALLTFELLLLCGIEMRIAFWISLLFAVHPVVLHELLQANGTEPISYFFSILALLLLMRPGRWDAAGGFFCFLLALGIKESAVYVPLVAALLIWQRRERYFQRFFIAALLIIPYWILRGHHMRTAAALPAMAFTGQFLFQAFPHLLVRTLWSALIPMDYQSWPPIPPLSHYWVLYLAGMLLACFGIVKKYGRLGALSLGMVLLPYVTKVPAMMRNGVLMNHWFYASLPGFFLLVFLPLTQRFPALDGRQKKILHGVILGWVVLLGIRSQTWAMQRDTDEKNYRWTLHYGSPDFALYRLGIILMRTNRPQEGLIYLEQLHRQTPGQADYENARGLAYAYAGQFNQAQQIFEDVLRRQPDYVPAKDNLTLLNQHRSDAVASH